MLVRCCGVPEAYEGRQVRSGQRARWQGRRMAKTSADLTPLLTFRLRLYVAPDHRPDSWPDLLDARPTAPEPTALLARRLSPAFPSSRRETSMPHPRSKVHHTLV